LVHDFFMLSPSYTLLDEDGTYRGPVESTRKDKAHRVARPGGKPVTLQGWRKAWGGLMRAAQDIVVFSEDSRTQVLTAFPGLARRIVMQPHTLLGAVPQITRPEGEARVIAVLGNIGYQKGAAVVSELGRMIETVPGRKLVLIGNVDPAYMPPASVPVHGNYRLEDLPGLVARYGITDWLVPSIWPETFSYTTHEALATGLPVYAFDIGAQGDAVAKADNGHPIPFAPDGNLVRSLFDAFDG
ncbi:glycosyltransferase, partial [Sedimentitalea sp.]|uniref:glycosyltransferase n=1 Tax=Sedimentitalea sp. TaxID=2048915 RepID=UPI003263ED03